VSVGTCVKRSESGNSVNPENPLAIQFVGHFLQISGTGVALGGMVWSGLRADRIGRKRWYRAARPVI
jgi:hypothetical protein